MTYLGWPQMLIGIRFFIYYYIRNYYFFYKKHWKKLPISSPFSIFFQRTSLFLWINLRIFSITSVIYYVFYIIFAVIGFRYHPFAYVFHLCEIVNKYSTLKNFLRAITWSWMQLVFTFVLYLIIEYSYTIIAYTYFYKYFDEGGKMCQSMDICFLTVLDMTFKVRLI